MSLDEIRIIQKATTVSSTLDSECVFKPFSRQSALANKNISSTISPSSSTERLISIAANGLMDFTAIKCNRIDSKSKSYFSSIPLDSMLPEILNAMAKKILIFYFHKKTQIVHCVHLFSATYVEANHS